MGVMSREYLDQHIIVRRKRGRPGRNKCRCGRLASDWAYTGGDRWDVNNYAPLCRSCHMKMDATKLGSNNAMAKVDEECVVQIREMYKSGHWLQREIAELFGLKQPEVSLIVNRRIWRHVE